MHSWLFEEHIYKDIIEFANEKGINTTRILFLQNPLIADHIHSSVNLRFYLPLSPATVKDGGGGVAI